MKTYRRKDSDIKALEWTGSNAREMSKFFKDIDHLAILDGESLEIRSEPNRYYFTKGDYAIVLDGEYRKMNGDKFNQLYGEANE